MQNFMLYGLYSMIWFFTYFVAYPLETEMATNQKDDITRHQLDQQHATGYMDPIHNGMS